MSGKSDAARYRDRPDMLEIYGKSARALSKRPGRDAKYFDDFATEAERLLAQPTLPSVDSET